MPVLKEISPHAHCEMCQQAVPLGDRRCGAEKCEEKFQEAIKAKRRSMMMLIGILVVALVLTLWGPLAHK
ncbi:MAG: DUF2116 family Zn-ribbon domain-containing protein [Thermoplasmatota archaeon]